MLLKEIPEELLILLSVYLIEPPIIIDSIGWDLNNNYQIKYNQKELQKSYNNFQNIVEYYIFNYNIKTIYKLHNIIYYLNTSFRKHIPTFLFSDKIFKLYPYITYKSLISLEFDSELSINKKIKNIESIHIISIEEIKTNIINELNYNINQYISLENIFQYDNYPFYLYLLDSLNFYIY